MFQHFKQKWHRGVMEAETIKNAASLKSHTIRVNKNFIGG